MPLDPNIPLGVKLPAILTPADRRAAQMKAAQDAQDLQKGALDIESVQRRMASEDEAKAIQAELDRALSESLNADGSYNREALAARLKGTPAIGKLQGIYDTLDKAEAARVALRKTRLEIEKAENDHKGSIGAAARHALEEGAPLGFVVSNILVPGVRQAVESDALSQQEGIDLLSQIDPTDEASVRYLITAMESASQPFASERTQETSARTSANRLLAELPGIQAQGAIQSDIAANMEGGMTPDQRQDNAVARGQLDVSRGNLKVAQGNLAVAQGNLAQRQKEAATGTGAGGARLGVAAIEKIAGIDQSLNIIADLEHLKEDRWLGPINGRLTEMSVQYPTGQAVPETLAKFYAQTTTLKNAVVKAITGAQMSAVEADRIMKQVPDFTDKPVVWKQKLDATRENLKTLKNRTIELSGGTVATEDDPLGIR